MHCVLTHHTGKTKLKLKQVLPTTRIVYLYDVGIIHIKIKKCCFKNVYVIVFIYVCMFFFGSIENVDSFNVLFFNRIVYLLIQFKRVCVAPAVTAALAYGSAL